MTIGKPDLNNLMIDNPLLRDRKNHYGAIGTASHSSFGLESLPQISNVNRSRQSNLANPAPIAHNRGSFASN